MLVLFSFIESVSLIRANRVMHKSKKFPEEPTDESGIECGAVIGINDMISKSAHPNVSRIAEQTEGPGQAVSQRF